MHFQWIVIHLLCMASALYGQRINNVFDYQPQQIHISFGGMPSQQFYVNMEFGPISLRCFFFCRKCEWYRCHVVNNERCWWKRSERWVRNSNSIPWWICIESIGYNAKIYWRWTGKTHAVHSPGLWLTLLRVIFFISIIFFFSNRCRSCYQI